MIILTAKMYLFYIGAGVFLLFATPVTNNGGKKAHRTKGGAAAYATRRLCKASGSKTKLFLSRTSYSEHR